VALVQRNFQLPVEQAEWLRTTAYERHVKQVELVRYALDATRADIEGRPRPQLPGAVKRDIRSLAGSFAGGPSMADELVEDRRWEARRDEQRR